MQTKKFNMRSDRSFFTAKKERRKKKIKSHSIRGKCGKIYILKCVESRVLKYENSIEKHGIQCTDSLGVEIVCRNDTKRSREF